MCVCVSIESSRLLSPHRSTRDAMNSQGTMSSPFHRERSEAELAAIRLCQIAVSPGLPPPNCFNKHYEPPEEKFFGKPLGSLSAGNHDTVRVFLTPSRSPSQNSQVPSGYKALSPISTFASSASPNSFGGVSASNRGFVSPQQAESKSYSLAQQARSKADTDVLPPEPSHPRPSRVNALPQVVQMTFPSEMVSAYEETILCLEARIAELESTCARQRDEIKTLSSRKQTFAVEAPAPSEPEEPQKMLTVCDTRPEPESKSKRSSSVKFRRGKSGVFGRLWKHAKSVEARKSYAGNEAHIPRRSLARHLQEEQEKQKRGRGVNTRDQHPLQNGYAQETGAPFEGDELAAVAETYTELARMSTAVHEHVDPNIKPMVQARSTFWIYDRDSSGSTDAYLGSFQGVRRHPLTTDASDIYMCNRHGGHHAFGVQEFHPALEYFLPRILSFLGAPSLEMAGICCQQFLIDSHHVHTVAFRAQSLLPRLEPLARCYKIAIEDADLHLEASERIMMTIKPGSFMELRNLHKPSNILVDVMIALGVVLRYEEAPWKYVRVDPHVKRKKHFGGPLNPNDDTGKSRLKLLGANWTDCQRSVQHVEKDGHLLSMLQRMMRFKPDTMSSRQLQTIRTIIKTGMFTSASRGGPLAAAVASWIMDVTHRALAVDRMKRLGRRTRSYLASAEKLMGEARWHARIRRKLNDGYFSCFFGWS